MAYAVYSTTAAVPSLALGLRKISYTPRPRLQVGYHLIPRIIEGRIPREARAVDLCAPDDVPGLRAPGLRPLGNALYLERLLMGGIVGEALPLTNLEIELDQEQPLGQGIDVVA